VAAAGIRRSDTPPPKMLPADPKAPPVLTATDWRRLSQRKGEVTRARTMFVNAENAPERALSAICRQVLVPLPHHPSLVLHLTLRIRPNGQTSSLRVLPHSGVAKKTSFFGRHNSWSARGLYQRSNSLNHSLGMFFS
jgi:hypothetical protein